MSVILDDLQGDVPHRILFKIISEELEIKMPNAESSYPIFYVTSLSAIAQE